MRDSDYEFYYTQDGSIGLYSFEDDDVYHSKFGALTEAWEKFVLPSGIDKLLNTKEEINVLDVCYGVGYNTKALISYVLKQDEKLLTKPSFIKKILNLLKQKIFKIKNKIKNIFKIFSKKEIQNRRYIDSIGSDNNLQKRNIENSYNESNDIDNNLNNNSLNEYEKYSDEIPVENFISKINIDCLEKQEELIKISPFLKTVFTPQEIFDKIVPRIFDCFDSYWTIRKKLSKFTLKIALKNRKKITELLDLKFNNDYDLLNSDYKIHKYTNFIIINSLLDKYRDDYVNKNLRKKIKERRIKRFFDNFNINYALFYQKFRYNFMSKLNLFAFLHNIYYHYISIRYKKVKFKDALSLFKLNFMPYDARKSILNINRLYDVIFLDAFTSSKAPELWTVEFIAELYERLNSSGILITYSTSALVRNTLLENKFYVGKIIDSSTGKCIGTIASKDKAKIDIPLSNFENGLCTTKAGIPYRDPGLNSDKETILKRREYAFKTSDLMTSTQYMRLRTAKNEDNTDDEW